MSAEPATQESLFDAPTLEIAEAKRNALGGFRAGQTTSRDAAMNNWPRSGSQRWDVLQAVHAAGEVGLTNDELALALGLPNGASGSPGKRAAELHRQGWICPSGQTRTTRLGSEARVWVLTDSARERLA